MSKTLLKNIDITTSQQFEILDVTEQVHAVVTESGVTSGTVVIFSPHTTTGIRINHYEPLLLQDIMRVMYTLVPLDVSYNHDVFELRQNIAPNERTNGHAHIKAFLAGASESLIVNEGKLVLGERQSVLFVEFDGARKRDFLVQVVGN